MQNEIGQTKVDLINRIQGFDLLLDEKHALMQAVVNLSSEDAEALFVFLSDASVDDVRQLSALMSRKIAAMQSGDDDQWKEILRDEEKMLKGATE